MNNKKDDFYRNLTGEEEKSYMDGLESVSGVNGLNLFCEDIHILGSNGKEPDTVNEIRDKVFSESGVDFAKLDINTVKLRIENELEGVNKRLSKTSIGKAQNRTVYLTGLSEGLEKALKIIKDVQNEK